MKLLILGGTLFLGRHMVDAALNRGHEITLFNRGQHNAELYPDLEKLRGDRDGDLDALKERQWDAVIDTCGYVPRLVGDSAQLLADAVEHYTFISSISVYSDFSQPSIDEGSVVGTLEDESVEEVNGETYGPLKALCEQAAEAAMPDRVLNVRAGLIVGPYDLSDRFTYWPHRVSKCGALLVPEPPDAITQFVHARDLSDWVILMAELRKAGIYNVTGPATPLTFEEFLDTCRVVTQSDAEFVWTTEAFLNEHEVQPFTEMPMWVPAEYRGMLNTNCAKAIGDGLTFRPLEDTIADTLEWAQSRPSDWEWRAGLKPEREAELLAAWQEQ